MVSPRWTNTLYGPVTCFFSQYHRTPCILFIIRSTWRHFSFISQPSYSPWQKPPVFHSQIKGWSEEMHESHAQLGVTWNVLRSHGLERLHQPPKSLEWEMKSCDSSCSEIRVVPSNGFIRCCLRHKFNRNLTQVFGVLFRFYTSWLEMFQLWSPTGDNEVIASDYFGHYRRCNRPKACFNIEEMSWTEIEQKIDMYVFF